MFQFLEKWWFIFNFYDNEQFYKTPTFSYKVTRINKKRVYVLSLHQLPLTNVSKKLLTQLFNAYHSSPFPICTICNKLCCASPRYTECILRIPWEEEREKRRKRKKRDQKKRFWSRMINFHESLTEIGRVFFFPFFREDGNKKSEICFMVIHLCVYFQ